MLKWLTPVARDILVAAAPVILARVLAAIGALPPAEAQGALPLEDEQERSAS